MFDNYDFDYSLLNEEIFQEERYERESRYGSDLINHMPNYNGGVEYD